MRTLACVFLLAAVALMAAADTDITGKWSGSFNITSSDGETKNDTAFMVLKQNGNEITGTVEPNEDKRLRLRTARSTAANLPWKPAMKGIGSNSLSCSRKIILRAKRTCPAKAKALRQKLT